MKQFTLSILFSLLLGSALYGSDNNMSVLKHLFIKMAGEELSKNKVSANDSILLVFEDVLADRNSITYSFDSIPGVKKLLSENEKLAIYTWNLSYGNVHEYFGFIQYSDKQEGVYNISQLENKASVFNDVYKEKGSANKWYGALYYSLVEKNYNDHTIYILLGFDFNDLLSKKRIIETMKVAKDGTVEFAVPAIKRGKSLVGRVVFEYSAKASMMLKYDNDEDLILFDHLGPISPTYRGHPEFYAPDLSIDGLFFSEGLWHYKADINLKSKRLPKSNKRPSDENMFPDESYGH